MAFAFKPKARKAWRIKYYDSLTAKTKTVSAYTQNEAEAKRKAKDLSAKLRLNLSDDNLISPYTRRITITEALQLLFEREKPKEKTKKSYLLSINHFVKGIGKDKYIFQLNIHDYSSFYKYLNNRQYHIPGTNVTRSISTNTKATYICYLHAFFNFLIREQIVKDNPIRRMKTEKKPIEIIPKEDLELIFTTLKNTSLKYYAIFRLIYLAALRAMEVADIKTSDIDFEKRYMLIKNSKGGRDDKIPMVKDLEEFLRTVEMPHRSIHAGGNYLYPFITYNKLKGSWSRCMKKLNFSYTIHQLRKTRGTEFAERKANAFNIKEFMRHESLRTTEQYYIYINLDKAREDLDG